MNTKKAERLILALTVAGIIAVLWGNRQGTKSAAPSLPTAALVSNQAPATTSRTSKHKIAPVARSPHNIQTFSDPELGPAWAVKFGSEFWRRPNTETAPRPVSAHNSPTANPPFALGDVMERVTHALDTDNAMTQARIDAGNYTARFDAQGLRFSPSLPGQVSTEANSGVSDKESAATVAQIGRPIADPATEILFRTVSIERDGQSFFSANGDTQWSVVGNTAQSLLSPEWGVVEHYEAGNQGVDVAWIFSQPLSGSGPIEITASVNGLTYAAQTDNGLHFADNNGVARVRIGQAFAVDSLGNRWELNVQPAPDNSGKLLVELPAAIQAKAVYPLAVDPIISAEVGMDKTVSTAASGNQANAAIVSGGGQFFVVWEDNRNSGNTGTDIYGTRVSNAGAILDPFGIAISTTGSSQSDPSVAAFGSTFLVTWQDRRLGGRDIFGARVSNTGVVLDPLGIAISVDPAQNSKSAPAVAGGFPGFMVVWQDNRNSGSTGPDIYGARLTTSGAVLDLQGIPISTDPASQANPTIATNSIGFVVAWEDTRNSGTTGTDIYGARVGTNGVVLDTNGVPITTASRNQTEPTAAANDDMVLVAWRDQRTSGATSDDIYGTRLNFTNNALNVLDTNGIAISTNASAQREPAVCALTNNFLVVWRDRRNSGTTSDDIYGARVDTNGNVLDLTGFVICNDPNSQLAPAVAANASGALVVWTDSRNSADTGNDIYGARVNVLGVLQDTNGIVISRSGNEESAPAVAFNGTNYLVAWQDERSFTTNGADILGTRVSSAGAVLDLHGIQVCTQPTAQNNPSVGASGGEFLVAWEDSRNANVSGVDIYGTRVGGNGSVLDPAGLPISTQVNDEATPVVAGNSTEFLVAWVDNRNNNTSPDIYCARVTQAGVISDSAGIPVTTTPDNEVNPAIAGSPAGFLVAWEDTSAGDVFAARIGNDGTVFDPSGSSLSLAGNGTESLPSVAALGTNYLVAWMDSRNSGNSGSDIYASRVFGDGSTPDANNGGFAVCTLPNDQVNPSVSANADTYVVVWQNTGPTDGNDLYSARIATNGTVLDFWTTPLAGTADRMTPRLAYGGGGKFLLVSQAFRTNSTHIVANLMTADPPLANLVVQFSSATYSVLESGKFAKISVAVTGKYSGELTVDFATEDETAVAGVDYLPVAGRLVFATKQTTAVVLIPIINDGLAEANKTLRLILQNPMGGVLLGARPTATLTILE